MLAAVWVCPAHFPGCNMSCDFSEDSTMLKVAAGKSRNTGIVGLFKAFELLLKYLGLGV